MGHWLRASRSWLALAALPLAGAASAQELVVRIGHVAPTSGWLARVGVESENAARMAIEELNTRGVNIAGRKARFELVAADDAADPNRGTVVARSLVAAQVAGVVGHMTSDPTMSAAKVYSDAGIPQISPSATTPMFTRQGYKTAFRVIADDLQVSTVLGRHAIDEMKITQFAVIDDGSPYGQGVAGAFSRVVESAGGRIVDVQHIDHQTMDFTAVLSALKPRQPEAIFFGGLDRQAGRLISRMKKLGITARLIGGDGICTPDLVSYWAVGAAQDGQVVCASPSGVDKTGEPAAAKFKADYSRRFGTEPRFYGPYAYDAVMVMVDAMAQAGSSEPAKYLPLLAATRGYRGASDTISFDDKGDLHNPALSIFTYHDEERRLIGIAR